MSDDKATGVAGLHAKAQTEGTAIRTKTHKQNPTLLFTILAIVATLVVIIGGYSLSGNGTSEGTSTTPVAGLPLGFWLIVGLGLMFASLFIPKKPSEWIKTGVLLAGILIFGIAFFSSGWGTQYFKKIDEASVCAATPTTPECVVPTHPVCTRETFVIQPGETVIFRRKDHCYNLNWHRVKGSDGTLNVAFNGDNGLLEDQWRPGSAPSYDGFVRTATLENCGDDSIKIIFAYHN